VKNGITVQYLKNRVMFSSLVCHKINVFYVKSCKFSNKIPCKSQTKFCVLFFFDKHFNKNSFQILMAWCFLFR